MYRYDFSYYSQAQTAAVAGFGARFAGSVKWFKNLFQLAFFYTRSIIVRGEDRFLFIIGVSAKGNHYIGFRQFPVLNTVGKEIGKDSLEFVGIGHDIDIALQLCLYMNMLGKQRISFNIQIAAYQ